MSTVEEISKSIGAHGLWKGRLQEAITSGKSDWTVAMVRSDSACDFGRWFDSLPEQVRMSRRGIRIRELHAGFHHAAAEVLALALVGKREQARDAMGSASEFGNLSAQLTLALMEWKKTAG